MNIKVKDSYTNIYVVRNFASVREWTASVSILSLGITRELNLNSLFVETQLRFHSRTDDHGGCFPRV